MPLPFLVPFALSAVLHYDPYHSYGVRFPDSNPRSVTAWPWVNYSTTETLISSPANGESNITNLIRLL